ncbi:MAG: hypothetical protein KDD44_08750, partial [Bdellovibrionales bacterium]|nr:hypothetical protein [Bdellovibrionales bacterium]
SAQQQLIFRANRKEHGVRGIYSWFEYLERKKYNMHVRVFLARYRSQFPCPTCGGARLESAALSYVVDEKTLPQVWALPIQRALPFFEELLERHRGEIPTEHVLAEVVSRMRYLEQVGLGYLTLDRQSRTLSGGESQRVNLTSILGARLVHTTLVLDEPSIGLHPRDTERLLGAMETLRDRGNSVLVVEHDQEVIRRADQVIDIGPRAGSDGGRIVFQGTPGQLAKHTTSLTGAYLRAASSPPVSNKPRAKPAKTKQIKLRGCSAHNLKNINVAIPLHRLTALVGVSGSGKSTFIQECLLRSYERLSHGFSLRSLTSGPGAVISGVSGFDAVDGIVLIDQSPVGRSPRANAGTYTKAWDIIRECLAATEEAERLGLSKSAFSFNVDGGRCPDCKGAGYHRVEMQFLADAFVECERCGGSRFADHVLGIRYAGKNVVDFLKTSLDDVHQLFASRGEDARAREIVKRTKPLIDLGLGYVQLGQPLSELSGGEAQRVKLASYLREESDKHYLFVLDEPTTGLHPHDITNLLSALRHLVEQGHSVLVIEHNMDVVYAADWMIELGPDGGEAGGELLIEGAPEELLKRTSKKPQTPTLAALEAHLKPTRPSAKALRRPPRQASRGETHAIEIR